MSSEGVGQGYQPGMQNGTAAIIKARADELNLCPDGWFYPRVDLDEENRDAVFAIVKRLADRGAIRTRTVHENDDDEGRDDNNGGAKWQRHREYRITDRTQEFVNEVLEHRNAILPCGHSGMTNCGDYYECSFELCDKEFSREDIDNE